MRPRIPSWTLEGLLYALVGFGPFAFGGVEPWSRAGIEVLALLLALGVFLKGRPAGSFAGSWFWLFPAAVAAFGCLQLTAPLAPGDPSPLRPFTAAPHETRAAVMLWAAYAAVLFSVPRVIVTPEAARRYARFILGLGVALACLGLLQTATGGDKLYWLRHAPRASFFASYYNRDHAANVLLMSLAVGLGIFAYRPGRRTAAALLVVFSGLVACASEASFIAIPLAAAGVAFLGADFARDAARRRLRAGVALAGAALTIAFAYRHVAANADAGTLIDQSVMGRLSIYGDAWRWWGDSPLFGTGLGGFEAVYPSYQDLGLLGRAAHAHSDWIEFVLEAGLFGLAGALLAGGLAAFLAARSWREARSSEMRALVGGGVAAAAAFAAHSLFEFGFQIPANAIMFFTALGFLLSSPSWADKSRVRPASSAPSFGAGLLAAAYCVVLMRAAVLPAAAARRAATTGEPVERLVALAEAITLDPDPAFSSRLSAASYEAAGNGAGGGYALLRISLRHALAGAESRPFDSDALHLAGTVLGRLERAEDSRIFFARAAAVRFARYEPTRLTSAQRREKKLETLREMKLIAPKPEAR